MWIGTIESETTLPSIAARLVRTPAFTRPMTLLLALALVPIRTRAPVVDDVDTR